MSNVSIHATLAGGDSFQMYNLRVVLLVSIHATLAGGDLETADMHSVYFNVSIHATLAGGDKQNVTLLFDAKRFYPRHPRGWRLIKDFVHTFARGVSIHATLAGGDTSSSAESARAAVVSIHATLAGGDVHGFLQLIQLIMFLSTPPSRVATNCNKTIVFNHISFYPRHPRGWRLMKV